MFAKLKSMAGKAGVAVTAAVVSVQAAATETTGGVLPADFDTQMNAVSGDITTVGGALIALAVVAVGIKWVKATFFG